jgi:hypothetical protein
MKAIERAMNAPLRPNFQTIETELPNKHFAFWTWLGVKIKTLWNDLGKPIINSSNADETKGVHHPPLCR